MQKQSQSFNDIAKKNSNTLAVNSDVRSKLEPPDEKLSETPASVQPLQDDSSTKAR